MNKVRCLVCGSARWDSEGARCGLCGNAMGVRGEGCYISDETKRKLLDHAGELSKLGIELEERVPLHKSVGEIISGVDLVLKIVDSLHHGSLRDVVIFLRGLIPEKEILRLRLGEPEEIQAYYREDEEHRKPTPVEL